ncbi:MAG: HlyD family efflux transporter periplasmic adaptor subunit [Prevotellaceae bacterium]|jgi:HlyD family secretion protein|nr:HlyD family efflux transporter periplasmic adaptor subunit [Prevotellaceae bacterium]
MDRIIEKKNRITKKQLFIIITGLVFVIFVLYLVFRDNSKKINVERDKISIATVTNDLYKDYIIVNGIVQPGGVFYLESSENGCQVEEILKDEGSMVNADDIIVRFKSNNLTQEVSNQQNTNARTTNELVQARLSLQKQKLDSDNQILEGRHTLRKYEKEFENADFLYNMKPRAITRNEYEVAKENYELQREKLRILLENIKQDSLSQTINISNLERDIRRMEESMRRMYERLDNLNFKAPVSGQLASLSLQLGQTLNSGTRIGQINILDSYRLQAEVDEYYIQRIVHGLTGECEFGGRTYNCRIAKIYPEVKSGKFTIDMEFHNSVPPNLRIGQSSRIQVELGEPVTALLVPRGPFFQQTGGQWIFVLDETQGIASKRMIRTSRQNPQFYEITEGLQVGEKVITSSYEYFSNAEKLIIK